MPTKIELKQDVFWSLEIQCAQKVAVNVSVLQDEKED